MTGLQPDDEDRLLLSEKVQSTSVGYIQERAILLAWTWLEDTFLTLPEIGFTNYRTSLIMLLPSLGPLETWAQRGNLEPIQSFWIYGAPGPPIGELPSSTFPTLLAPSRSIGSIFNIPFVLLYEGIHDPVPLPEGYSGFPALI